MRGPHPYDAAGPDTDRRLFVYNGGFLTQSRIKRILSLSGFKVTLGAPGPDDLVGVWGMSPTAHRGERVAAHRGAGLVRVEDAWLRSLFPGRAGAPPLGLVIDQSGIHYDPSIPSDLETLLASHPLDDTALLDRARGAIARMKEEHLSKFSAVDPQLEVPAPGYVLVVDQTEGDASVTASGADRNRFLEMLFVAREEHPGMPIVIKAHPETTQGYRKGYFGPADADDTIRFVTDPVSPWHLLDGAVAVFTVSSQLGFEAIFAGHKPRVFGAPFYAGWGLTTDEFPVQRRQRTLSRAQLFAATVLLYPKWYDVFADGLCSFETALDNLAAETRAWREDRQGWVGSKMRLWKRSHLQSVFGSHIPMIFEDDPSKVRASQKPWMVWASKATVGHADAVRVEDGFLRSRGLGAELVPPLSLVLDDMGIYYDATSPSRLEQLIAARETLRPDQETRARNLIRRITRADLTKYNLDGAPADVPDGHRVLVVGQVEDDASLRLGGTDVRTNASLLAAARAAHPDAVVIYKTHPDVDAGLRDGGNPNTALADLVLRSTSTANLLAKVDEVWTITSLLGFEALLRGLPVTTIGVPFYAGWGLTDDLAVVPPRRRALPSVTGLVHACLIDYPRYIHPDTQLPCPVEAVVTWLENTKTTSHSGPANRMLAKLQGLFASQRRWWQ
ncbi:MAG: capsular polysaccharide biosynthesis protein [Pseudomonadota bacterium]